MLLPRRRAGSRRTRIPRNRLQLDRDRRDRQSHSVDWRRLSQRAAEHNSGSQRRHGQYHLGSFRNRSTRRLGKQKPALFTSSTRTGRRHCAQRRNHLQLYRLQYRRIGKMVVCCHRFRRSRQQGFREVGHNRGRAGQRTPLLRRLQL